MNKRKQAALDTRKKLLEVGERLIAEKGFDNVSVEDITEESGVSKGTFYTYFPHKEDIVYHISLDAFDGLKEEILAMKDTGIAERLRRYTYKFMECVERYGIMICRQWVRNEICEDDCVRQDLSLPLFENDLLDSLAVVELLVELESAFGIVLSPSEVTREDIGTPQKIIDLVRQKKA